MPGKHARLSPSSAHRWRKCSAAPNREDGLPDTSGIEAAEGTVFHEYGAMCLEFGLDPHVFIGAPMDVEGHGTLLFNRVMADSMLYGLDYLRDMAAEPGALLYVETRVNLAPWLGTEWSEPDLLSDLPPVGEDPEGTADALIVNVEKRKIINFDWKYGAGIPVSPVWNDQCILYLLGCWNTIAAALFEGIDPAEIEVDIIIEQPRAPGGGGVWHTNMAVILAEGHKIIIDAEATKDADAPATPGVKQCQFCRAAKANTCKERITHHLRMFDLGLEEVDELAEIEAKPPLPKALTPEQRSYILLHRSAFTKFLDDLHAEAYDDATKGRPVPLLKLVPGRSPARAWLDEEKTKPVLERAFGDDAYVKKVLSPTGVEEKVGKKRYEEKFKKHVKYGEAKPILVPEYDKRPAIANVGERFDNLMNKD